MGIYYFNKKCVKMYFSFDCPSAGVISPTTKDSAPMKPLHGTCCIKKTKKKRGEFFYQLFKTCVCVCVCVGGGGGAVGGLGDWC